MSLLLRCCTCLSLLGLGGTALAGAAASTDADTLDTVEVSATRLRGVADVDVPASVTTVQLSSDGNQPEIEVTEALSGIPGVTALDRQNYAQDTQLSIRGFGARATFGVRGLRLYADGVPASMPDGQGQLSHFSVMGADRLQVMRGPFSALYGNSSGGVVQIWSKPGETGDPTRVRATYGSYDARSLGATDARPGRASSTTTSRRRVSRPTAIASTAPRGATRPMRAWVSTWASGARCRWSLNYLDLPEAQDPLGLTPAALARRSAARRRRSRMQFNTRKSVEQLQGGMVFEQALRRGADAARDGLLRQSRGRAVPRDSGRHAGQSAELRRRRRSRQRLLRRGPALVLAGRARRATRRDHRRAPTSTSSTSCVAATRISSARRSA